MRKPLTSITLTLCLTASASLAADGRVADSAEAVQPVLVGTEAPHATVRTLEGESTDLHDLLLGKKTVLIFYRGGW